jgi:hypothetical protein
MRPSKLVCLLIAIAGVASCAGPPAPTSPTSSPIGAVNSPSSRVGVVTLAEQSDGPAPLKVAALASATATTFTLSGVVTDQAYPAWKISGATITLQPGGVSGRTNAQGAYSVRVRAGSYSIQIKKAGYAASAIRKAVRGATVHNVALKPTRPAGATARCKDRTWSKSQNRSGTCSHHRGVAYWVCPGKLCR